MGFGAVAGSDPRQELGVEPGCGMLPEQLPLTPSMVWGIYTNHWVLLGFHWGFFWLLGRAVGLENTESLNFSGCWWRPLTSVFAQLHRNAPHPLLIPVFLE